MRKRAGLLLLLALPAQADERKLPVDLAPRAADVQMLRDCVALGKDCAASE